MSPADLAALLLVGVLCALLVVTRLGALARTGAPVEAIRRWADARGYLLRGDGTSSPLEVLGAVGGRRWTLGLFVPPAGERVLVLSVDCESVPSKSVDDGVLVARIVNPAAALFAPERLDGLVAELVALAMTREAEAPAEPEPE